MARIVCQVLHRPNRITFIWSEGAASFEPYHLQDHEAAEFYEVARTARRQLAHVVQGNGLSAATDLANAGYELYQAILRHNANDAHAREIEHWLNDLRDRNEVASLDMLGDVPGAVPWNAVYDQAPASQALSSGDPAALRPFWGIRYVLAVGKRVNPLRVACVLDSPTILLVADPDLVEKLPAAQRNLLSDWAISRELAVLDSVAALRKALQSQAPDILYIFASADQTALRLGDETITIQQLRDYLTSAKEGNPDPIVFLQACGDPANWQAWECFLAATVNTLTGVVLCEVPPSPALANVLGVAALSRFLDNHGIGEALQSVRADGDLAALAYSAFCPSHVKIAGDDNTDPDVAGPEPLPLPDYPYHPLVPFDSEDRGLFTGREDDTIRCAGLVDEAATHGLILHGAGGVGKTSFLRAGLVPHLETEAVGYLALRDRTLDEEVEHELDYPVVALRPGVDLIGQLAEALCVFCAQPFTYATPTGKSIDVDLPGILQASLTGASTTAIAAAPDNLSASVSSEPLTDNATFASAEAVSAASLWRALRDDTRLLAALLDEATRRLPYELVIVVEQAEDLVLQAGKAQRRRRHQALAMIGEVLRSAARCKVILSVRTEFFGRLMDQLPNGPERWRNFFLGELSEEQMLSTVLLPTLAEPVPYSSEIPRQKYQFAFEQDLPQQLVHDALKAARDSQRNPLPLLQVLCADLYERMQKRQDSVITKADRKSQGQAEDAVVNYVNNKIRDLPIAPADRSALRNLIEQLYLRHTDGAVTRALVPTREVAESWKSGTPLDAVVDAAAQAGLLEVNQMLVEGRPEVYLSLPQEVLARVAAQWDDDRRRQAFGRTRIIDTLWIMIPMLFLVAAITWTLTRRSVAAVSPEDKSPANQEQLAQAFGQLELTRWPMYVGDVTRAEQAWNNDNALLARQILLRQQALKTSDLRDFEWYYLWNKIQGRGPEGTGHKGFITSVAIAPDGATGASASLDGTVKLWNLAKAQENATLLSHAGPVLTVAFAPDGRTLATGGADKIIRLWDARAGKDKFAKITKEQKTLSGHTGEVRALAFGPQGLVSAGADKQVITWDLATGKQTKVFKEHMVAVQSLALAPDGKTIASAGADQTVLIHDGAKTLHALKTPGPVTALAFAPDGKTLATANTEQQEGRERGMIRFWDVGAGKETGKTLHHASGIFAVGYVPQTKLLASAGKDNLLRVWDPAAGRQVAAHKGHLGWVVSVAAAGADATLVSGSLDGTLKIWSSLPPDVIPAHEGAVQSVLFAFDDKVMISGGRDGTVKFWDPATGKLMAILTGLGGVSSLAISSKQSTAKLAAGTWNDKNEGDVRLWDVTWDVKDGVKTKELPTLKGHTKGVGCLGFSADGKTLASGSADGTAILWDMNAGKQKFVLKGHEGEVRCLAFPNEASEVQPAILITGAVDGKVRQWDIEDGKELRAPLQAHTGPVNAVRYFFGVVGFVTAGEDHSTKFWIWNLNKQPIVRETHRSNSAAVTSMMQSPNRRFLATGSLDQTVKLFDSQLDGNAPTAFFAHERFTFAGLNTPIHAVAVAGNSLVVAGAGEDGTIHLWRAAAPSALKTERVQE